jgi:hypothetical protein
MSGWTWGFGVVAAVAVPGVNAAAQAAAPVNAVAT